MKIFSGFPSGKLEVTPLPNLFFSELLPAIDDLAELKVTLHLFWLIANQKKGYVRHSELRADRTLIPSLSENDKAPAAELDRALARAVERGTLLALKSENDAFYFPNTDRGRRSAEQMTESDLAHKDVPNEDGIPAIRPNIFSVYEQNIGLLTPMLTEELKEAEREYPAEWIGEAIKIAVENNKRSWSYIRKVLERWKTEGRGETSKKRRHWWDDEYDKYINR